jgi:ankyrin repeat protein
MKVARSVQLIAVCMIVLAASAAGCGEDSSNREVETPNPQLDSDVQASPDPAADLVTQGNPAEEPGPVDRDSQLEQPDDDSQLPSLVSCLPQAKIAGADLAEEMARKDPESTLGAALVDAALNGNLACVRKLLSSGAPPNGDVVILGSKTKDHTPLVAAAQAGSAPVMKALLEAGANPNLRALAGPKPDDIGLPPLVAAVSSSLGGAAQDLISRGADVNAADGTGMTSLHWAAVEGNLELVRLLVEKGAKVDVRDREKKTPLEKAIARDKQEVVEYLRDRT